MRRSVLSSVLAATLSLFACSEQPTEVPTAAPPITRGPASLVVCTATEIQAQIDALFPAGDLRTSAQAQFSSIPKAVDKESGTAARDKTIAIVDFLLTTYYAGQLTGGLSTATLDQVLDLIRSFYCFARLASPDLPSTSAGADVVLVLVSPGDPTTTVVTPSEHAAVTIPEGAVPAPTLIAVSLLPDDPPPLRTSLDQYPLFYHFSGTTATGPVTFNLDVTAGVCLRDNIDVPDANLRLAHNVGPLFGDVEILPRPAFVPGLDCTDLGGSGPIGSRGLWGEGRFAWAERLLLPAELHATSVALATTGVGGTTQKFSEFGVVDIFSNPGSFSPVSPASVIEEGGSIVTRTVLVTSANGTPIPGVPVTFATEDGTLGTPQPVLTDASGNASANWTLPEEPGTYTLTADAPAEDNSPLETTDPPAGNVASNPDVAFDPTSLTFTATISSPLILTFGGGNGQTGPANQILTAPVQVIATDGTGPVQGVVINFAVIEGSITPSATTDENGLVEVLWTLGPTVGSQTGTVTATGADPLNLSATATTPPAVRAVLEWGATPSDLDFHLTGPGPSESRFHVYYPNPCYPGPDISGLTGCQALEQDATLDRDDTDSFGPETITINQVVAGTYRFSVHNFSNRLATSSEALSLSQAKVTVYLASGTSQTFNVPAQEGTLWTVFELSGTTITPRNTMSYESNPASTTAFSILGRTADVMQSDAAVIRDATAGHPK